MNLIRKTLDETKNENSFLIYDFLVENGVLSALFTKLSKLTEYWTPFINIEVTGLIIEAIVKFKL